MHVKRASRSENNSNLASGTRKTLRWLCIVYIYHELFSIYYVYTLRNVTSSK